MPIYEYECSNCQHHFDLLQKVNDPVAKQCPKCFMETLTKVISPVGFQLKGSGWYASDFKDKPKTAPSSADAAPAKETEKKPVSDAKKGEAD